MARPKTQFCPKGHDTFVCGRDKNYHCRECNRLAVAEWRQENPEYVHQYYEENREDLLIANDKYREEHHAEILAYSKEYKVKHKEEIKIARQKHYEANKDRLLAITRKFREEHPDYMHRWYEEHKDEVLTQHKEWREANPDLVAKINLRNKINRGLRIPLWTDWENINAFERNKPKGMTTDHIIPLQGDDVSGLHVSWNLQYMPKPLNSSKNNRCNLIEISNWYGKILEEVGLK